MLAPFFGYSGLLSDFDTTAPYVHVREVEKAALFELEVPRFRKEEISVSPSDDGTITIVGKRAPQPSDGDEYFMFGYSQATAFRRVVQLSPAHYDLSKTTSTLDHGVLTISVPKKEVQPPVNLIEGSQSRELTVATTPEEFAVVARAKWPPAFKRGSTDKEVTYRCELPPTVTKDHMELVLEGGHLTLTVHYQMETKSKHSSQSQSVSYSTAFGVPQGTKPEDIHTEYENGVLTIHMAKHETQGAIPIQSPKL